MKTCLVSGFEPFGGQKINPAWEAVQRLPDTVGDYRLVKMQMPVVFGEAGKTVMTRAAECHPDLILLVGQAGGSSVCAAELVGLNIRDASSPDNGGNKPWNQPVVPGGENALFSTLPLHDIVPPLKAEGLPVRLSYSAGAYVCNDVFYSVMHACKNTGVSVEFVHLPYMPGQGEPSLPLEQDITVLTRLLERF